MARTFKRYTLAEFITVLRQHVGKVKFSEVHVHATWKPTIADFRRSGGLKLQQAMQRAHLQRGFNDIAQHVTIDPDGYIWEGRPLTVAPASATGHNDGDSDGEHPFMFEMIGNFDRGCELLEGAQLETTLGLTRAIMSLFGVPLKRVRFHRDMTSLKTCPGSGVNKAEFMRQLQEEEGEDMEPIKVEINGKAVTGGELSKAGVVMVPLRAVGEALGAKVSWDKTSKTARVKTKK
ncbi:N-acetylmuramoyl-L-alanine amidase [Paenibacillus oenotherae]|uniref:N-acetylmuramoyl-L-alanine amidase n=1 Tax=Paenibacillus oenotherae TaxID=1435645 RepID=A0ABS7D7Q3_9BACL|nr:stalk domain-containing protein [Paenibacillus oenotherae]MBW7475964.1 N-acetylmuramoyl-L-alanine amidase [Paenibacillus oenotherae]